MKITVRVPVYSWVNALAGSVGMVGFALDALCETFFSPEAAGWLILLTYETLAGALARALDAVYRFLGLPPFAYDLENVAYDAGEFDWRLGAPGLHRIGGQVAASPRTTILPPAMITRYSGDTFWRHGPKSYRATVV